MNRKYHVSRLTDAVAAVHNLEEMEQLDGLRSAHITEDLSVMDVDVDDERLEAVMEQTVNICRRISRDCELSYMFSRI